MQTMADLRTAFAAVVALALVACVAAIPMQAYLIRPPSARKAGLPSALAPHLRGQVRHAAVVSRPALTPGKQTIAPGAGVCVLFMVCCTACGQGARSHSPAPPTPSWECKQCEKIVGELQQEVIAINSSYTAKIQDFFNTQICPQMPAPSQKTCLDFANTKLVELWNEAIDDVLDPEEACVKMLVCADAMGDVARRLEEQLEVRDIVTCKLCKRAAKFIDKSIFKNPDVDAKLADALASFCMEIPDLPPKDEQKCEVLVRNNTAELMEELGDMINARFCQDAGLCPLNLHEPITHLAPKAASSTPNAAPSPEMCNECTEIVAQVQDFVKDVNASYGLKLEKFVDERVCPQLPVEFRKGCVTYVHRTLPQTWEVIIDDILDPKQACTSLGICGPALSIAGKGGEVEVSEEEEEVVVVVSPKCKICKEGAKLLAKQVFENPVVQREVALELVQVCNSVPGATEAAKAKCAARMNADTAELMEELGEGVEEDACKAIKVCPKP